MSVRPLHLLGSPVLREKARAVGAPTAETAAFVQDLFDTMRAAEGVGLAANQVGLAERVAVVDTHEGEPIVLIDPEILERYGRERGEEGCLSIPGTNLYGDVDRATRIVIATTTLDGERVQLEVLDHRARAVQHEIDHLDGVLFIDHLSPLKRRMLLRRWEKQRKGKSGYLQMPALAEGG
ncbi:MAG: peptide deformylase [Gemmatimonadota bacterium]|nr:peptide deformylase [Gemmatimonadota bacterium]MDH4349716.1 peptide deformylase [Gemmatimonadota bacterium]MDH5196916.1 peptide deformylase [Gemmatimonadota bacterium]